MQGTATVERRRLVAPAIAAALLVSALGLWLSGATVSSAEDVTDTQGLEVDVGETIAWNPPGCIPDAATMQPQSFEATPGTPTDTLPSVACVSSNSTWDVTAQMTTPPTRSGGGTIPESAFSVERLGITEAQDAVSGILTGVAPALTAPLLAGGAGSCEAPSTTCTLETAQTVVNNAAGNRLAIPVDIGGVTLPGGLFVYDYRLDTPPGQAGGDYTGGVVTFTASN
jgi:hypothetical protein